MTGTVVNLRTGPGTDHATAGQVRVTGRNADGSWLQVADPTTRLWLYGPLTDIDADADRYGGSDVKAGQGNVLSHDHPDRLHHNAYLVPLIDDGSDNPAGSGPCMEVTRAG